MRTKMISPISIVLLVFFISELNSSPFTFLQKESELSSSFDEADCLLCKSIAAKLEKYLNEPQSVECVATVTTDLCNLLNRFTPDICTGIGNEYAPSIYYALQNKGFNPNYLCGTIIKGCTDEKFFEMWNITMTGVPKPNVTKPVLPPANTTTYRVLHLSDIHYDKLYTPGTEAYCDEPLCCRPQFGPGKNTTAGYWGTPAKCDMPIWTLENLLGHLRNNETWDWMVWTGDMPPHDIWEQTRDGQVEVLNTVYDLLYKYLYDKQIYLAVGNHESMPMDSFPPLSFPNVPVEDQVSWLYDQLAANWSNWVSHVGDTQKDIKQMGSYVTQVMPGLRMISLNTQNCDEGNIWLYANQTDPAGGLAWLIQQLQSAEDVGDKVHIIGHIPSGDHTCLRVWSANYYNVINRYESTITGLFFGHTHSDQFSVFYDNANTTQRPTEIMYVGPSVTTFSWRMPTYRIYTLDSLSFEVLDHETYMLNLTEANLTNKTEWKLEYKASEAYGLKSLFAQDWSDLIKTFATNSTMFNTYYSYFDRNDKVCDDACKYDRLCEMRSGRSHDKNNLCSDLPNYPNRTRKFSKSDLKSMLINIPPECAAASTPTMETTTPTMETTSNGAHFLNPRFRYEIINIMLLFILAFLLRA